MQRDDPITAVRRYNRFYTQRLGLLNERLLGSRFSLTEARVLYELAQRDASLASDLAKRLSLDRGYLSRLLRRFEAAGVIARGRGAHDARTAPVRLTGEGRKTFASLDRQSRAQIEALMEPLDASARERLVDAMATVERLLDPKSPSAEVVLRRSRPGDVGWVVERHGALYASEFGYDATFEGLVARIAGDFLEAHDPARERCWIADRAGERVGAVFVVRLDDATAKLRLLFVEPSARGLGVGRRLVAQCTSFAREAGYRRITLWTQSHLAAARQLYVNEGYKRIAEAPHRSFGLDLVAETWELAL
ncbi:MAG TPA: helix-turn-helix domain-containing GNAT family N-acetyltransferase [Casimicrobiaceae bacterium]|nr:helix-turn-helix domain-containing GNAT family N-acetyltransferase [Casimicrobiaceae bacterium]